MLAESLAEWLAQSSRRIPIAIKMVLGIILVGGMALGFLFVHENMEFREHYERHLLTTLQEGGEDDRLHMEQHFHLYLATTHVYGQCSGLRDFLATEGKKWPELGTTPAKVHTSIPVWFPLAALIKTMILPRFAVLMDGDGKVREIFEREIGATPDFQAEAEGLLRKSRHHPEIITHLGGKPFLVSILSVQVQEVHATLILADPIDDLFLREAVNPTASKRIVTIMDNRSESILASSRPEQIPSGLLQGVEERYLMTPRNHLSLEHSELDIGFVSFLEKNSEVPFLKSLLFETTKHRFYFSFAFILPVFLIAQFIAIRLRGITQEFSVFAVNSLSLNVQSKQSRDEVDMLHEASQELQQKIISDRARQTAGFEDLAMHMHISRILRSGGSYREVLEMALDILLNLIELNPPHTGCVLFLQVEKEVIFTEKVFQIMAERGVLPSSIRTFSEDPVIGHCLYQRLRFGDEVFLATECTADAEPMRVNGAIVQPWVIPLKHANQLYGALILLSLHGVIFSLERFNTMRLVGETIAAHLHAESLTASLLERHKALTATLEETQTATKALRQSENRLSGILAMLPTLFIEVDHAGVVCQWNQMATKLTGIAAGQAVGLRFEELPIQWDWEKVLPLLKIAKDSGTNQFADRLPCRQLGNKDALLDVTITPLRSDEHGGYILMAIDISERASMEVRLSHAQKMEAIGTLAAGIAHEINTPTQFIGDNTHFLKDAFTDLDRLLRTWHSLSAGLNNGVPNTALEEIRALEQECDLPYLQEEMPLAIVQILQGVERISSIVRAMKDFSYPDQGMYTKVDINKAIMDTVIIARNEYKYVAELETLLEPDLPLVPGYRNELNQVFLNILVNAAHTITEKKEKQGVERGQITISTQLEGQEVIIRFTDTGMGIPEALRLRIFEPFFTTKVVGKGTGQGLAIVHSVVVGKHGGTIQVESEIGLGTTFVLRLPMNETKPFSDEEDTT